MAAGAARARARGEGARGGGGGGSGAWHSGGVRARQPCASQPRASRQRAPRPRATRVVVRCEGIAGIDLGTTNSCVAIIDPATGTPRIVRNAKGDPTTPSVVAFVTDDDDGSVNVLVGDIAKRQAAVNPLNTFYSAKRFMGLAAGSKECDAAAAAVPYGVVAGETEEVEAEADGEDFDDMAALTEPPPAALTCPALGVALAPEAIAAEVLRTLLRDAERELGEPVTKAVIGVPAYFSDEAVAATVRAGEAAGLTTVRTIREPVAAAMAYGFRPDMPEEVILVFDLGGGTFDVSVLVVGGGIVETLSTGGDTRLGGDDFDARVAEHVLDEALGPALGAVAKADPAAMQRLAATSEAVKKALSDNPAVTLRLPFFVQSDEGPVGVEERVTRNLLEKICADELRRLRMPVELCFEQAGMELEPIRQANERREREKSRNKKQKRKQKKGGGGGGPARSEDGLMIEEDYMAVTQVVMVGGATRMPCVQRIVRNCTGIEPEFPVNPDEAVALGAAVRAGMNSGVVEGLHAVDPWQAALVKGLGEAGMLPIQPLDK